MTTLSWFPLSPKSANFPSTSSAARGRVQGLVNDVLKILILMLDVDALCLMLTLYA
jgi:hypothetical protein